MLFFLVLPFYVLMWFTVHIFKAVNRRLLQMDRCSKSKYALIILFSVVGKHRGFAFVEFEAVEDAAAAIDNMVSDTGTLASCIPFKKTTEKLKLTQHVYPFILKSRQHF